MFIVTPEWFNKIYSEFEKTKQGKQLLKLTGISRDKFNFIKIMNDYFYENKDITIDPNANIGNAKNNKNFVGEFSKVYNKYYSFIEMHKFMFEMGISQKEIEEIIKNIISGYYYPHDQTTWATLPYCVAVSTYPIMVEGRPYGQLHSLPPKRTQSFVGQVIEYVIDLSQEFAGAVALGDFIINYVYYEIQEQLSDKEIENHFQSMVHVFNNGFRVGSQSPFTNISFMDRPAIRNTFKDYYYPNGDSPLDEKYLEEIMRVQYIFMNFIAKKDPKTGSPLRFPVATCNITIENNQIIDKEFFEKVCELNREGIFNIYITDNEKARIASCCRILNDITELMKFKGIDSFGNGGVQLGSDRVVTINLPRIAIESIIKKTDVKKLLSYHFDKVVKILISHRLLIKDRIDKGFLKFFKPLHWLDLDKMFYSTVGLVGFYEFSQILGYDLLTEKGRKFLADILKFLNDKLMENATKYGVPLNMEQVPAESSAITLAKKDNVLYNTGYVMYANQFIPLWVEIPLTERIKIDGEFDEYFGGGVISHLNVGSVLTKEQMAKVIQFAIQSGLKHFAINPKFSICKNNHVFIGDKCPTCGEEVIDYITRIVGYFVPVSQWVNERKNWEFSLRKWVDKV